MQCGSHLGQGLYERHKPEEGLLYKTIAEHWATFRERSEEAGGLPRFVTEEFEAFLGCGILSRGLAHLVCSSCGAERLVAFSCKTGARRFAPARHGGFLVRVA
jgi:hypothetical protein